MQKKTIVIDARVVVERHGHGIARHTDELIRQMIELKYLNFNFILLVTNNSPYLKIKLPENFSLKIMKKSWINILGQFEVAFFIWKIKPDLFHSPSFIVPLLCKSPLIATIHDLNHVVLAKNYAFMHQVYYKYFLSARLKKAKAVITISNFSKQEIVKYLGVDKEKVCVIYNGISDDFKPINSFSNLEIKEFKERYELPEKYILALGNRKPHKNMRALVTAFCKGDINIPLALLTEFDPVILEIAESYKKKHLIHFIRFIPSNKMSLLYGLAKLFVFPSVYEGFGLPPIEAAACGIPVVVSNRTSLPEIMGNSAVYFNPDDIDDIKSAIEKCIYDKETLQYNSQEAIAFVKRYSWKKMAQETFELYNKVMSNQNA